MTVAWKRVWTFAATLLIAWILLRNAALLLVMLACGVWAFIF